MYFIVFSLLKGVGPVANLHLFNPMTVCWLPFGFPLFGIFGGSFMFSSVLVVVGWTCGSCVDFSRRSWRSSSGCCTSSVASVCVFAVSSTVSMSGVDVSSAKMAAAAWMCLCSCTTSTIAVFFPDSHSSTSDFRLSILSLHSFSPHSDIRVASRVDRSTAARYFWLAFFSTLFGVPIRLTGVLTPLLEVDVSFLHWWSTHFCSRFSSTVHGRVLGQTRRGHSVFWLTACACMASALTSILYMCSP